MPTVANVHGQLLVMLYGHKIRVVGVDGKNQDNVRSTRGKCSEQRPCTDVLAHPRKQPLMSALPTKDAGTYKDSIVIHLLKHRPKKITFGTWAAGKKQPLFKTRCLIILCYI